MNSATVAIPIVPRQQSSTAVGRNHYLDLLRRGIEAAQADDKTGARSLLREALSIDDREETGWLWLASVAEGQDEVYECMERALLINPYNEQARNWVNQARQLGLPSPLAAQGAKTETKTQPVRRAEQEVRRAEQEVRRVEQEVRRVEQEVRRVEREQEQEESSEIFAADETVFLGNAADLFGDKG